MSRGRMQHIAEAVDLPAKLRDIGEARAQFRARQLNRYGWPDTVRCAGCGDTGRQPDAGKVPCYCVMGQEIEQHEQRERDWEARMPRRFQRYTLDSHPNRIATERVEQWCQDGMARGQNLILLGSVGVGKTGLAIGALRAAHIAGRTVRYGTVPTILDAMRPRDKNNPDAVGEADLGIRTLQRVHVLLMDDLGTEKETEWAAERIYMVINGRYERELPTIVTTNRTMDEMRDAIGTRAVSRLTEDADLVHVAGHDLRRAS